MKHVEKKIVIRLEFMSLITNTVLVWFFKVTQYINSLTECLKNKLDLDKRSVYVKTRRYSLLVWKYFSNFSVMEASHVGKSPQK